MLAKRQLTPHGFPSPTHPVAMSFSEIPLARIVVPIFLFKENGLMNIKVKVIILVAKISHSKKESK